MSTREERGMAIAATQELTQNGDSWLVPSQSAQGKSYIVRPDAEKPYCSCPDHDTLGIKCKHIFAVECVIQRTLFPNGDAAVTQTVTVTETVRKTYAQDWPAYNAAQTHEKEKFLMLLHDLCRGIKEPVQMKGRKRIPLADAIFCACFKIYSTVSCRRFMSDLRAAQEEGYIQDAPHFNSIFNTLENPALFDILRELILQSSLPLKAVETKFAVDSSGFSTSRFVQWYNEKYGKEMSGRAWVKAHICCGVKTNIVTAIEILDQHANDCPQLPPLVETTAQNFKINEVSGDKGYSSALNFEVVAFHDGTALIPFKSTASGKAGGLWAKMFHYFCFRQEEFLARYHKRSNVESTFSMVKSKFRDHVRSKGEVAQKNEVLCKFLCHNICVLIQEMYELGIEPIFWASEAGTPTILPLKRHG